MPKPSRRYLADLRDLKERLQRQLKMDQVVISRRGDPFPVYHRISTDEREHWRELLKLCESEIRRVEKELGRRGAG